MKRIELPKWVPERKSEYLRQYSYCKVGDKTRFEGKHELIIPAKVLREVQAINEGRAPRKNPIPDGEDVFRGWFTCAHPECQRQITYERKEKKLKSTGEAKIYHFYRCSNSRKIHDKKVYISEEKIWQQLEPAVGALEISPEFAQDIADALNETAEKQRAAIKKQMEGFRLELRALEGREDGVYADFKGGVLDEMSYKRQIDRVRAERQHYELSSVSRSRLAKKRWSRFKKCSNWRSTQNHYGSRWIAQND
jgi:hypothetical protein